MKNTKTFLFAFMAMTIIAAIGMAEAQTSNNPVLILELSTYDPIPAEPGTLVDIWVNIQNTGGEDAENVEIEFVDTAAFSITSEDDRIKTIPVLGAGNDYVIKYTVLVSENVADGPNDLTFRHSAGNMPGFESTSKVSIDIKSTETAVAISDIELNPAPVEAGGKTQLTFNVQNLARSSSIRNVDITVQLTPMVSGTTLIDLPFVTVNSGNQQSISRIAAGESGEFTFDIAVYPEAESKLYKLPVTLSYYDDTGRQYNKTIFVGVEVNAKPDLLVTLDSSDINLNMDSGNVLFNIINRGTSNVKLMTLTLVDGEQYDVLSPSNQLYLGNIDSDDFETARFNVKANSTDELTFDVELKYKDSLNNEYTEIHKVSYVLEAPAKQQRGAFPVVLVVILLIIGGIVWYKRSHRRK